MNDFTATFICADQIPEFKHLLYHPESDIEIIDARDCIAEVIKSYATLKDSLIKELDYQITKAENNQKIDPDLKFHSYALLILAQVENRQVFTFIKRILSLNEQQFKQLDIACMDIEQCICSVYVQGDDRHLLNILNNERTPFICADAIIKALPYIIEYHGLSKAKVFKGVTKVFDRIKISDCEDTELLIMSTVLLAVSTYMNDLQQHLLNAYNYKTTTSSFLEQYAYYSHENYPYLPIDSKEHLVNLPHSTNWLMTSIETKQIEANIAKANEEERILEVESLQPTEILEQPSKFQLLKERMAS